MTDRPGASPTTIVVPIYGDLPSILECLDSLVTTVDLSVHRILLANDNGPEADTIERALLPRISGHQAIGYIRNERTLGFVGNCNRAVLEVDETGNDILLLNSDTVATEGFLDELSAVLHLDETHGAVCPRSDNATIATIPFALRDPRAERSRERTSVVHHALRESLPRFSVAPVAMGFCLLIRRELIREYGLFDEAFAPGYGEENDFCLRVARHGFRSLIAHRALVFHAGSKSFGRRREALRSAHERLLVERYPDYPRLVSRYLQVDRDAVDAFADCLVPAGGPRRILIDLSTPGPADRRLRAMLPILRSAADVDCVVLATGWRSLVLRATTRGVSVTSPRWITGQWDAAIIGGAHGAGLARANRLSPRWLLADKRAGGGFGAPLPDVDDPAQLAHAVVSLAAEPVDHAALRARWARFAELEPPARWAPGTSLLGLAARLPGARRLRRAVLRRIRPSAL